MHRRPLDAISSPAAQQEHDSAIEIAARDLDEDDEKTTSSRSALVESSAKDSNGDAHSDSGSGPHSAVRALHKPLTFSNFA